MTRMFLLAVFASACAVPPLVIPEGPTPEHGVSVMLSRDGEHYCGGTWIGPDRILTAAHCLHGGIPVEILVHADLPSVQTVPECADFRADVAVLRTRNFQVSRWALTDLGRIDPGDRVSGIGAPNGRAWGRFEGMIAVTKGERILLFAPVRPGHSGGGLFRNGLLLGVITHYSPDHDFGIAISASVDSLCSRNH